MGAMRTQGYSLCYPEEIESVINFDGIIIPQEVATPVSCSKNCVEWFGS